MVDVPTAEEFNALKARVDVLEGQPPIVDPPPAPVPEPEPIPEPVPEPIPEPIPEPPEGWDFEEISIQVNLMDMIGLTEYGLGGRYLRARGHRVLTGMERIRVTRESNSGGAEINGTVKVFLNGVLLHEQQASSGRNLAYMWLEGVDTTGFPDGRYLCTVECDTCPDATSIPFPVYVLNEGVIDNSFLYSITNSYDLKRSKKGLYHCVKVPGVRNPEILPFTPRNPVKRIVTKRNDFWVRMLVPRKTGDLHVMSVDDHGIVSLAGRQAYYRDDLREFPEVPAIDGARGFGTTGCLTHMEPAIAGGGIYGTRAQSVVRVWRDGRVQTRAGYRHKTVRGHDRNQQDDVELVGNWDAVADKGFSKVWGWTWWQKTLEVDETKPTMPLVEGSDQMLHPHSVNPVGFVPDSGKNRVCKLEFPMDAPTIMEAHDLPPVVTVLRDGLSNPYDNVMIDDFLIVAERTANRISILDPRNGDTVGVLIETTGGPVITLDRNDAARAGITQEDARELPCVAPEGLAVMDKWVYWGSALTGQVKRIHFDTREVETVCTVKSDNNTMYHKIAVAKDNSILPKGSVLVATWSAAVSPFAAYGPDGQPLDMVRPGGQSVPVGQGENGHYSTFGGYPTAVSIGEGLIHCSDMSLGIMEISARKLDDVDIDINRYLESRDAYYAMGGLERWGDFTFNPWGLPPPEGYYTSVNRA